VVPQYGALGAAWVVSVALTLVRGVYLAVVMCRVNALPLRTYLDAVYTRPLVAAAPAVALAMVLRAAVLPGHNWFELIAAASLIALVYFAIAFFVVLDAPTRSRILARVPGTAGLARHA